MERPTEKRMAEIRKADAQLPASHFEARQGTEAYHRRFLLAEVDALTAERDRAHKWLDEFQGTVAAETIRAMEATQRAERAEAALDAERKAHAETRDNATVDVTLEVNGKQVRVEASVVIAALGKDRDAEKARADALEARLAALVEVISEHVPKLGPGPGCGRHEIPEERYIGCDGCERRPRRADPVREALSDLTAAAQAYRDRVRAEALEERSPCCNCALRCGRCGLEARFALKAGG